MIIYPVSVRFLTIFLVEQWIGHGGDIAGWRVVVLTDHKCFNAGISAAPWLAAGHFLKEEPQLRVEQLDILTTKDLGHKVATISQHMGGDIQCLQ